MRIAKVRKGWHATAAQRNPGFNLLRRETPSHIDERRILRRRTSKVLAMAQAALIVVNPCPGTRSRLVLRQAQNTCHLICVHVDHAARAIYGRPSPFGAPKKAGKYNRLLVKTNGYKLTPTA